MKNENAIAIFLKYLGIGFLMSAIKMSNKDLPPVEFIKNLFFAQIYNLVIGIFCGMGWMFGVSIFYEIKKNLKNENSFSSIFK